MGFIVASKDLNRLTYFILFNTLSERQVVGYVARIVRHWHTSQTMFARWSGMLSNGFYVTNSIIQCVLLYPYVMLSSML